MSQAEFARYRGVSRKAVTDWKKAGLLVLTSGGQIDVAATDLLLNERPESYRGGVTNRPKPRTGNALKVTVDPDEDENLPLADAIRRKENYLGLLRKRELEISNGEWVRIEDVGLELENVLLAVRERLLPVPVQVQNAMPPEAAQLAHDLTQKYLYDAMQAICDGGAKTCAEIEASARSKATQRTGRSRT